MNTFQPARLATSGLGEDLLMVLMHSLFSLSDITQLPTELLPALAAAVPDAFSGSTQPTSQLLECYSLLDRLCKAYQWDLDSNAGQISTSHEDLSMSLLLGLDGMEGLQQHLLREFVQKGSLRLSIAADTDLQEVLEVMQLLQQYQVPWSEGFVAKCLCVCNTYTQCISGTTR